MPKRNPIHNVIDLLLADRTLADACAEVARLSEGDAAKLRAGAEVALRGAKQIVGEVARGGGGGSTSTGGVAGAGGGNAGGHRVWITGREGHDLALEARLAARHLGRMFVAAPDRVRALAALHAIAEQIGGRVQGRVLANSNDEHLACGVWDPRDIRGLSPSAVWVTGEISGAMRDELRYARRIPNAVWIEGGEVLPGEPINCRCWAETVIPDEQPAPDVWITREGRHIPLPELTDSHLANALKMLARSDTDTAKAWSSKLRAEVERRQREVPALQPGNYTDPMTTAALRLGIDVDPPGVR